MIAFDTEDNGKGKVTLINFYDGKEHYTIDYKNFKNQYEFKKAAVQYISIQKERVFVAHNIEYDLVNIFYPYFIDLISFYYSGRLIYARLNHSKKKFIDTFNFTFTSLKQIGHEIGLEKIDTDDFYNIEYCRRDTEIVYKFLTQFEDTIKKQFDLPIKNTIAGTAFNLYCTHFLEEPVLNKNTMEEILLAYYGGRTECFVVGDIDRPIYQVDVNSMYPYVMLKNFPLDEYSESVGPLSNIFIAEVKLKIKNNVDIPILPKRDGLLFFPTGEFQTWVTSIELQTAVRFKMIESCTYIRTFNFFNKGKIFTNFVKYFYKKREEYKKEKNDFMSNFYKRFLNSVYGRFALKSDLQIINSNESGTPLLNNMYTKKIEIPKLNINYIIPVFITAYARVELFMLLQQIKNLNGIPCYSDTDSVYFTFNKKRKLQNTIEFLHKNLAVNNTLGGLSLEAYRSGSFYNAKSYRMDYFSEEQKFKQKGIPANKRKEYQETGKTEYERPQKLRPALRGVLSRSANVWDTFKIENKGIYKKRNILNNKIDSANYTSPLIFKD